MYSAVETNFFKRDISGHSATPPIPPAPTQPPWVRFSYSMFARWRFLHLIPCNASADFQRAVFSLRQFRAQRGPLHLTEALQFCAIIRATSKPSPLPEPRVKNEQKLKLPTSGVAREAHCWRDMPFAECEERFCHSGIQTRRQAAAAVDRDAAVQR
jgi:hypothetical protein